MKDYRESPIIIWEGDVIPSSDSNGDREGTKIYAEYQR